MTSTKEFTLKRINEIHLNTGGFNKHSFRWRNLEFNGIKVQKLDYENLSDRDLVNFFELVIFYYYKQG